MGASALSRFASTTNKPNRSTGAQERRFEKSDRPTERSPGAGRPANARYKPEKKSLNEGDETRKLIERMARASTTDPTGPPALKAKSKPAPQRSAIDALVRANAGTGQTPSSISSRTGDITSGVDESTTVAPSKTERRALEFAESYNRHMAGLNSVSALLGFYARNATNFDVVNHCVALARLASLAGLSSGARDAPALLSEPVDLMLAHLRRELASSSRDNLDTRVLASTLHSLAKLGAHTARAAAIVRNAAPGTAGPAATATLAARRRIIGSLASMCFDACERRLPQLPPRALAMVAYAGARLGLADVAFMRRVSDLTVSGVVPDSVTASWPPHIPPGSPLASRRAFTSPFEMSEAAMLATAYAQLAAPSVRARKAAGGDKSAGSVSGGPMLVPIQRLTASLLPLLPYAPHSLLATLAWCMDAAKAPLPVFQMALASEVALRASAAVAAAGGGPSPGERAEGGAARGEGDDDASAAEYQRKMAKMFSPVLSSAQGGSDGDDGASSAASASAAGVKPGDLSPRSLGIVLKSYASLGASSPQLFTSATAYFLRLLRSTSIGHSGSGSGGGSAKPAWSPPSPVDGELVSTLAWSLAKARHEDASTPALWASVREAVTVQVAAQAGGGGAPESAPGATAPAARIARLRPHQVATVLWALTSASVPAPRLAASALASLTSGRVASYTLPALAQLLWACAVQGVAPSPALAPSFRAAFEHVADLMALQTQKAQGGAGAGADSRGAAQAAEDNDEDDEIDVAAEPSGPSQPALPSSSPSSRDADTLAASLHAPAPHGSGVAKVQGQLYTAWLALRLELNSQQRQQGAQRDGASLQAALDAVPAHLLPVWRAAASSSPTHGGRFHSDVVGVLTRVGLRADSEALTPEGLSVDALLTLLPAASPGGGAPRRIVIEVQGPTHYVGGGATAAAGRLARAGSTVFDGDEDDDGDARGPASAPGKLVPTLKTRAKLRWLAAAGYEVVTVNWREWERAPSTQERAELLAGKGVPVPREHLSW